MVGCVFKRTTGPAFSGRESEPVRVPMMRALGAVEPLSWNAGRDRVALLDDAGAHDEPHETTPIHRGADEAAGDTGGAGCCLYFLPSDAAGIVDLPHSHHRCSRSVAPAEAEERARGKQSQIRDSGDEDVGSQCFRGDRHARFEGPADRCQFLHGDDAHLPGGGDEHAFEKAVREQILVVHLQKPERIGMTIAADTFRHELDLIACS